MLPHESIREEFDERFPIYEQIVQRFCRSVVSRRLKPGERIPSIRDTALVLKVNTNTVQRAYQEMERKNLIFSQRGTGYFIMNDETMVTSMKYEMVKDSVTRFLSEMRLLGFNNIEILTETRRLLEGDVENGAS